MQTGITFFSKKLLLVLLSTFFLLSQMQAITKRELDLAINYLQGLAHQDEDGKLSHGDPVAVKALQTLKTSERYFLNKLFNDYGFTRPQKAILWEAITAAKEQKNNNVLNALIPKYFALDELYPRRIESFRNLFVIESNKITLGEFLSHSNDDLIKKMEAREKQKTKHTFIPEYATHDRLIQTEKNTTKFNPAQKLNQEDLQ